MNDINTELLKELSPIGAIYGLNLLSVKYLVGGGVDYPSKVVVVIEKQNGEPATIDDCSLLSQDIAMLLDVHDKIKEAYTLEVSSKGCDDRLFFMADYTKNAGRLIEIWLKRGKDNQFTAQILSASSGKVTLKRQQNNTENVVIIPMSSIEKAILL